MMGVVTFTDEFTSPVPAPRLFKALILDADDLMPKIVPQVIKNVETIEGNGGPGSIKQINLAEGKAVKHKIDALDKEKMTYAYTMIEGEALMNKLESISYEMKFESSPDGGCIGKNVRKYHSKPGAKISEEETKAQRENVEVVFKAVEAYLLANPNACA